MRITGGTLKGQVIQISDSQGLRPTSGMVREAIFSTLEAQGLVKGRAILDLYAGSGAFGIEALSRGAEFVQFVENNRPVVNALKSNLVRLELEKVTAIECTSVETFLKSRVKLAQFDLIFADPPYGEHPGAALLDWLAASGQLKQSLQVIIEAPRRKALQSEFENHIGFSLERTRIYGDSVVYYFLIH